jgi:hypothetical protein
LNKKESYVFRCYILLLLFSVELLGVSFMILVLPF